jgi:hypothetical protein
MSILIKAFEVVDVKQKYCNQLTNKYIPTYILSGHPSKKHTKFATVHGKRY